MIGDTANEEVEVIPRADFVMRLKNLLSGINPELIKHFIVVPALVMRLV